MASAFDDRSAIGKVISISTGIRRMNDYLCITLLSRWGEDEAAFKSRLSILWTHMLRHHESDFEKVYAEKSEFEEKSGRLARQYLVEAVVVSNLETIFKEMDWQFEPIDRDDLFSKYEAAPPEWFWIEH